MEDIKSVDSENPDSLITAPRRRGRPRKNKATDRPSKPLDKKKISREQDDKTIVLHLPIFQNGPTRAKSAQAKSSDSDKNTFASENDPANDEAILTISDQESPTSQKTDGVRVDELIIELRKKNKLIKQMKEEIMTLKNAVGENAFMASREIRTIPMNISFVDNRTGKPIICERTNVVCWHDTCQFDTLPCFIPERYYEDTFYVFGCFCSFDCAAAYNLKLGDYKVSDRYSLIKKLHFLIKGTNDEIPVAPPCETLDKFGGPLTLDEFRKVSRMINKEYKLLLPPMINRIACIEERSKDKNITRSSPDPRSHAVDERNMIPVKKKLLHDGGGLDIIDSIGIKERRRGFFED